MKPSPPATVSSVFTPAILRPETQDLAVFVDGIENICEAQARVARRYLEDGSIEDACPPLRALLHIMAEGQYEGRGIQDTSVRAHFTRDALLASDWYRERLTTKQQRDIQRAERLVTNLRDFMAMPHYADEAERLGAATRLARAEAELARVRAPDYPDSLVGTIGADPLQPRRTT